MDIKQMYEKMIDFRLYGIVLLTVGAIFYLGLIIPTNFQYMLEKYIAAGASTAFLVFSVFFFSISRVYRKKLNESEEGQEYIMKKERSE